MTFQASDYKKKNFLDLNNDNNLSTRFTLKEIYRTLEWSEKMMLVLEQERKTRINTALSINFAPT